MSLFNPEKLIVTYLNGVKSTIPIIPRCYTLTHSVDSGELFLTIGPHYSWAVVNQNRDEVLGEWRKDHGNITCCLYLFLDHAPIIVHFLSTYSEFSKQEN